MKKAMLLLTLTIVGCDNKNELVGHWKSESEGCDMSVLCSFNVIEKKKDSGESQLYVEFDENRYNGIHGIANGELIKVDKENYYVEGQVGNYELTYKNGSLISIGERYHKVK